MASELISVALARERILASVAPLAHEKVEVSAALDRVLAHDVTAAGDVPPFACSAMDGYAVVHGPSERLLRLVGESRAGTPWDHPVAADQAVRISTGAAVPAGATAIIRQEDTEPRGEQIRTRADVSRAENIRHAAEDLRAGATVLSGGARLGAPELGAAVAAGVGHVTVASRPRVSVLCTGDELRAPGEPLGPGEIHNSNAPMLAALAVRAGGEVTRNERVPDDRARTERLVAAALGEADVVVVSGGVSVGPHDHVKPALAALDVAEMFWGIALQPGKPTWFGMRGNQLVFGLPGNPVSAFVTFALLVSPALAALQGLVARDRLGDAELGVAVSRDPRRERAVRVRLDQADGRTVAVPTGAQESHIISSLLGADALAMIPAGPGKLEAGERAALWPLPR